MECLISRISNNSEIPIFNGCGGWAIIYRFNLNEGRFQHNQADVVSAIDIAGNPLLGSGYLDTLSKLNVWLSNGSFAIITDISTDLGSFAKVVGMIKSTVTSSDNKVVSN